MNILPGAACTVEEWASLKGSDLPRARPAGWFQSRRPGLLSAQNPGPKSSCVHIMSNSNPICSLSSSYLPLSFSLSLPSFLSFFNSWMVWAESLRRLNKPIQRTDEIQFFLSFYVFFFSQFLCSKITSFSNTYYLFSKPYYSFISVSFKNSLAKKGGSLVNGKTEAESDEALLSGPLVAKPRLPWTLEA